MVQRCAYHLFLFPFHVPLLDIRVDLHTELGGVVPEFIMKEPGNALRYLDKPRLFIVLEKFGDDSLAVFFIAHRVGKDSANPPQLPVCDESHIRYIKIVHAPLQQRKRHAVAPVFSEV